MADDHRLTDPRAEGGSRGGRTARSAPAADAPPADAPAVHAPADPADSAGRADLTPAIPAPRGAVEPRTGLGLRRVLLRRLNPMGPLRRIPLTVSYLVVLTVTTIILAAVGSRTAHDLLAWSSTDVSHLDSYPVRVLLVSALWLPDRDWLGTALAFMIAVAPVERRVGPRWTLAILTSAHVIATLGTELPVAWAVSHGYLAQHAEHRLDVGVSYLLYGAFGALLGLWPRVLRWPAAAAVLAGLTTILFRSSDPLTASGHVVAFVVGITWWFWLARRGLLGGRFTIGWRAPRRAKTPGPAEPSSGAANGHRHEHASLPGHQLPDAIGHEAASEPPSAPPRPPPAALQ